MDEKFTLQKEIVNNVEQFKQINDFVSVNNTGSVDFIVDSIYSNIECKKYVTIMLPIDKIVLAKSEKQYVLSVPTNTKFLTIPQTITCYMYVDYINPLTDLKESKSKPFIIEHN